MQEHHELDKDDEHTTEQIQLMQSQDIKYITMKRTIEANKIQRMQSELHMIDVANNVKNEHIFFTDDDTEEFDLAKRLDTHPALLNRRTNRPRLEDLNKMSLPDINPEVSSLLIYHFPIKPFKLWIPFKFCVHVRLAMLHEKKQNKTKLMK